MSKIIENFFGVSTIIFFIILVIMFIYYATLTNEVLKNNPLKTTNIDVNQAKKQLNLLIIISSISFTVSCISLGFIIYNLKEKTFSYYISWFFFLIGIVSFLTYASFAYSQSNKNNNYNWKQINSIDMNVLIGLASACILSILCLIVCKFLGQNQKPNDFE